jgi:hypothetical protein
MATIVPTSLHPEGEVFHSLAGGEFKLSAGGTYKTDDEVLLGAAESHPWLRVERAAVELPSLPSGQARVAPEDDVLSAAHGSTAFDPEAIRKTETEKLSAWIVPTAIDAGLDQDKKIITGGVAETLAAEVAAEESAAKAEKKAGKA